MDNVRLAQQRAAAASTYRRKFNMQRRWSLTQNTGNIDVAVTMLCLQCMHAQQQNDNDGASVIHIPV